MMSLNHNSSVNSINSSLPLTSSSLYNSRLGSSPTFLNTSSSSSSSPMMSPNSSGYYSSHPSSPVSSFSSAVSSPVRHHQQHPQYHHEQQQHPQYQQPHRQLFPQNEILMQNLINLLHISNWKLAISTQWQTLSQTEDILRSIYSSNRGHLPFYQEYSQINQKTQFSRTVGDYAIIVVLKLQLWRQVPLTNKVNWRLPSQLLLIVGRSQCL